MSCSDVDECICVTAKSVTSKLSLQDRACFIDICDTTICRPIPVPPDPGLAVLEKASKIHIEQKIGKMYRTEYLVKNESDVPILRVVEDGNWIQKCLCYRPPSRLLVFNMHGAEVMQIRRPVTVCLQVLDVYSPSNNIIGVVKRLCTCCTQTSFQAIVCGPNKDGCERYRINGPLCVGCCGLEEYVVYREDNMLEVANFYRTGARGQKKHYGVSFGPDLSLDAKATLFAALLLCDFLFYEVF